MDVLAPLQPLDPTAKYYHGILEITCGEYEFKYHYFVNARTYKQACNIMRNHAKEFYSGKAEEDFKDVFFFHGGCVSVGYDCSGDKRTIMEWIDYAYIAMFLSDGRVDGKVRLSDTKGGE